MLHYYSVQWQCLIFMSSFHDFFSLHPFFLLAQWISLILMMEASQVYMGHDHIFMFFAKWQISLSSLNLSLLICKK